MKLVFRKSCSCDETEHNCLPLPRFNSHAPSGFNPEAIIDLSFKCPSCGKAWLGGLIVPDIPETSRLSSVIR